MTVTIITEEQKDLLVGQQYCEDSYFNPIQDKNGNWVISKEEIDCCDVESFNWLKDLNLSIFEPIPEKDLGPTIDDKDILPFIY
jgi:hypothetical protein